jgi:hypothetical protein
MEVSERKSLRFFYSLLFFFKGAFSLRREKCKSKPGQPLARLTLGWARSFFSFANLQSKAHPKTGSDQGFRENLSYCNRTPPPPPSFFQPYIEQENRMTQNAKKKASSREV